MMSKAMGRGHSQNAALGSLFLGTSKFNPGLVGLFYFIFKKNNFVMAKT
jgi:hypothetical protein